MTFAEEVCKELVELSKLTEVPEQAFTLAKLVTEEEYAGMSVSEVADICISLSKMKQ